MAGAKFVAVRAKESLFFSISIAAVVITIIAFATCQAIHLAEQRDEDITG